MFYTNKATAARVAELATPTATRRHAVPLEDAAPPDPHRGDPWRTVTDAEADAYYDTRARISRLGAMGIGTVPPARRAAPSSSAAWPSADSRNIRATAIPRPRPTGPATASCPERDRVLAGHAVPPARPNHLLPGKAAAGLDIGSCFLRDLAVPIPAEQEEAAVLSWTSLVRPAPRSRRRSRRCS